MTEWVTLVENVTKLKSILDSNYPQHKTLIKYLDNENLLQ